MPDILKNFYEIISLIDLIYLVITIFSVVKCYNKGFVLSLLAASKWLLAYVVTLILVVFVILMINKGIGKAVKFVGLGRLDSIFGLFFGFIRSYVICVCLFSAIDIVYNYNKWPINVDKSYTFPYLKKGSNYLVKEFPNEEKYQDSKEKIKDI